MRHIDIPFNVYLLNLTPEKLAMMKPVTALDNMDGATSDFHPEGLFSTKIFNKVGDRRRETTFSYIDIKVEIFHPLVYHALTSMKSLHADIMACKKYAIWSEETKGFIPATPADGQTGMHFFIQHWKELSFEKTGSSRRELYIDLVENYKDIALTSKIVVQPAGLRDMEIGDDGRRTEDEINTYYRAFLRIANSITQSAIDNNPEIIDRSRFELQRNFNTLYNTLENTIKGKRRLFQGSVLSRRVQNGTRNVITAGNYSVSNLDDENSLGFNSTIVGLYQFSQAIGPVTIYKVRELLRNIFLDINEPSLLIDQKTLKIRPTLLPSRVYEKWGTNEGLRKTLSEYREEVNRDKPIVINGQYLALLYVGPDMTFRLFNSIDELPADRSREHVRPISLTDLLYMALYQDANKFPAFVTRYPMTGLGSIYPSLTHLRVTSKFEKRVRLDSDWQVMDDSYTAHEFPITNSGFINSLVPHPSHLDRLGADFDGDTSSYNVVYSIEAINEVTEFLKKRQAYVGPDGGLLYGIEIDTISIVLNNMTGEPEIKQAVSYREHDANTVTFGGAEYSLNRIFEQLTLDNTRPLLLARIADQIPSIDSVNENHVKNVDYNIPVLMTIVGDEYFLLDGKHRVLKAKTENRHWVRAYVVSKEMLQKARIQR